MTHLQTFTDVVLALAFTEVILKPIVVRLTKHYISLIDKKVGFIPDWLHSLEQED